MGHSLSSLWRSAILPAFLLSLLFLPSTAFAVVGDVTLTGLPPNTAVSLTNEETKEKVEHKTDDRGFVVIPMTGKNWQSGRHSVACQVDGKPVTSRIFLRDGANRVDLTALTYSARPRDPANAKTVDEALKKSSAALKADPKNSQALLTQGSALNRLGRHGQALSSLAQAVKLGSTHPALAFETGWSLLRLGMYREAIAQLEKYEKMKPGLGHTSEFIGRSHLYMGELDKADAKFKEAIQRDPRLKPTALFHQAVLETLRKNPEAASNHIGTLLKEAPNSPTAQIFKNALLQAPGAKPAAGAGAKDYKLSDPIRIQMPPTTAGDVAGAIAKGVVGGLLGGLFGGGGREEPEGPKLAAKPALPETTLASKDGKTKINLSGAIEDGKPYIVMGVKESPGNGAPHLIMLQDKNCNVLQPKETSVTGIWEQWGGWKLTVSWTKSYYQDGQLVKQEKGGWSTPWNIFRTQIKDPSEIPGIWKDFGGKPFEATREVMSSFELSPGVPFIPADWNLITHATTDAGNNQILTAPFVTGLGTDQNNNLIFKPMDRTVCESAPPTAPLLANMTTFPWTVGPFGIGIAPDAKSDNSVSLGVRDISAIPLPYPAGNPKVEIPPDLSPVTTTTQKNPDGSTTTTHTNPADGSTTRTQTDRFGHTYTTTTRTYSGGSTTEITTRTNPDGSTTRTYTDILEGTFTTTTSTDPDGRTTTTTTQKNPDGSTTRTNPDGSTTHTDRFGHTPTTTTTTQKNPDGSTTTTYSGGSTTEITTRTNPDGSTTRTYRDILEGTFTTTTSTDPDGRTTTTRTNPDGRTTTTHTDRFGHTSTTRTNPDGSTTTTTTYSGGSTTETQTDRFGHTYTTTTRTNPDGSTTTTRTNPADGSTTRTQTDRFGHTYTTTTRTNPDGSTTETTSSFETRSDGTMIETRSDGTKIVTFRDGSSIERDRAGGITFHDPPQTAQPASPDTPKEAQTPPEPTDSPDIPSLSDNLTPPFVPI